MIYSLITQLHKSKLNRGLFLLLLTLLQRVSFVSCADRRQEGHQSVSLVRSQQNKQQAEWRGVAEEGHIVARLTPRSVFARLVCEGYVWYSGYSFDHGFRASMQRPLLLQLLSRLFTEGFPRGWLVRCHHLAGGLTAFAHGDSPCMSQWELEETRCLCYFICKLLLVHAICSPPTNILHSLISQDNDRDLKSYTFLTCIFIHIQIFV